MPIKINEDLPAFRILEQENIFAMTEKRALIQDIRPLKVAIVNLMPTKTTTETQLLRLLANTPLQIEISLVRMEQHSSKNTGEYLDKFYIPSGKVFEQRFDGMIITGAPVEKLDFEQVDYWRELCTIMDYAKENVFSTLYLCWGAFAGLYHLYGIPKYPTEKKIFGVFQNRRMTLNDPLLRGLDDEFPSPQSRYTTLRESDIAQRDDLIVLAKSEESGVTLVKSKNNREVFMTIGEINPKILPLTSQKTIFRTMIRTFRRIPTGEAARTCFSATGLTTTSIRRRRLTLPQAAAKEFERFN